MLRTDVIRTAYHGLVQLLLDNAARPSVERRNLLIRTPAVPSNYGRLHKADTVTRLKEEETLS